MPRYEINFLETLDIQYIIVANSGRGASKPVAGFKFKDDADKALKSYKKNKQYTDVALLPIK